MKSSTDGTIRTFITLRIAGDTLVPEEITETLGIAPLVSYRKGQDYISGKDSIKIVGKTGVWYFDTDKIIYSNKIMDHLTFILGVLCPEGVFWGRLHPILPSTISHVPLIRLGKLKHIIEKRDLKAGMTFFWHGTFGAKHPAIPRVASQVFRQIPIDIETDFDTEENPQLVRVG